MRRISVRTLIGTAGLVAVLAPQTASAKPVTLEACIVDLKPSVAKPTAALMKIDNALFELDLRGVRNADLSLQPGDCVDIAGDDRGTQAGLQRQFPQASWLVQATSVEELDRSTAPKSEDDGDSGGDDGGNGGG